MLTLCDHLPPKMEGDGAYFPALGSAPDSLAAGYATNRLWFLAVAPLGFPLNCPWLAEFAGSKDADAIRKDTSNREGVFMTVCAVTLDRFGRAADGAPHAARRSGRILREAID